MAKAKSKSISVKPNSVRSLVLEARTSTTGRVDADVIVTFQDSARKPIVPRGAYAALTEKLREGDSFAARPGTTQFIRFGGQAGAESVLVVGLGAIAELTEERARQAGGNAWAKLSAEKCRTVSIDAELFSDASQGARELKEGPSAGVLVRAFAEGLALAAYQFNRHKSQPKPEGAKTAKGAASSKAGEYAGPTRLTFIAADKVLKTELDSHLVDVTAAAEAVRVARDWSNEPSNFGTPEFYANEARRLAREYGLKCTVLGEAEAAREKMGLFTGVSRGSVRDGRIVVLEYNPPRGKKAGAPKTLAFVGKGVTFDSGGISIKPSTRMEEMKHDMTGAATLMGAILLAAAWKSPNRIVTVLAFCENMPDGGAIQPGNVLTARNGKTVEIINTDAEGRLVLADVLDYAQDFKPDAVIDAATLTGAVGIALGKQCAAILGNDETLIGALRRVGDATGERLWQLPLFDEYFEDMRSETADMKNSCNDSYGGVTRGAIFLKQFIRKGVPWAHLDIAAMASNVSSVSYFPRRGATGAYVRTLARFAAEF
jgi:leucyl aminopeptidase